jgi:hypothetical protein
LHSQAVLSGIKHKEESSDNYFEEAISKTREALENSGTIEEQVLYLENLSAFLATRYDHNSGS